MIVFGYPFLVLLIGVIPSHVEESKCAGSHNRSATQHNQSECHMFTCIMNKDVHSNLPYKYIPEMVQQISIILAMCAYCA